MIKEYYCTTFRLCDLDEEKYDKLIDFLEDNNITYLESNFSTYTLDTRSEQKKYDDWLSEQADLINDERWLEEHNE